MQASPLQRHKDKERIGQWTELPPLTFLVRHLHTGHDHLPQSEMGKAAKSLEECIAVLAQGFTHHPVNPNMDSRIFNMCHAWKALESINKPFESFILAFIHT